ncbi:MAG: nitrite reductase small subunit NirD [Deltaproteobacteria bacterium]|nr:nitrite reductase small subunit NirD [Deltaproteobacteria bacterium]
MADFMKVARTSDIPPGSGKTFEVGDKPIAVFNCDGTFYAIDDTCPHQGGPLGEGEVVGTVVTCPWHEWSYDVRSGVNTDDPTCKVSAYPVKVEGGDVLVAV